MWKSSYQVFRTLNVAGRYWLRIEKNNRHRAHTSSTTLYLTINRRWCRKCILFINLGKEASFALQRQVVWNKGKCSDVMGNYLFFVANDKSYCGGVLVYPDHEGVQCNLQGRLVSPQPRKDVLDRKVGSWELYWGLGCFGGRRNQIQLTGGRRLSWDPKWNCELAGWFV
jgi:RNase P subunit RPR2